MPTFVSERYFGAMIKWFTLIVSILSSGLGGLAPRSCPDILSFINRMLMSNCFRKFDREKLWFAPDPSGCSKRVKDDLAANGRNCHERVDLRIFRHPAQVVRGKQRYADLIRIDTGFRQDHAGQQLHIFVRPTTPTLRPARSSISLIFGGRSFLLLLARRPENDHRTTTFLRMIVRPNRHRATFPNNRHGRQRGRRFSIEVAQRCRPARRL